MTISLWRYSHLTLAISSFVFIIIASVTGLILAFEPISNAQEGYCVDQFHELYLGSTLEVVKREYDEVLELKIDPNHFVSIDAINKEGKSVTGYIDPRTGQFLGERLVKSKLFRVTTNLHRSLFLKSTGRIIIGITSFLLFIIAVTGTILIIKRQLKVQNFFSKVIKDNFSQYWHTVLGRLLLLPIIIITLTGVYLSLYRFDVFPKYKPKQDINYNTLSKTPKRSIREFIALKDLSLSEVRSVEFPFSKAVDDFYTIKLVDKTYVVNQFTGELLSETSQGKVKEVAEWSIAYHTGQGSVVWSIVLLASCISILFFIYSGFQMTFKRRKNRLTIKNKHHKDYSDIVILVGSETGNTFRFAKLLYKAILATGKRVYISNLNAYTTYKQAKYLIILTSTYGDGEAPIGAKDFKKQFKTVHQKQVLKYAIIGFGSKAYEHYCQFAIDVETWFKSDTMFKPITELHKINNQSFSEFKEWARVWSENSGISIDITNDAPIVKPKKEKVFKVVSRTPLNIDSTFLIRLRPNKKLSFKSGDLLSLVPKEDGVERLYSIGKLGDDILLSVKKHEFGICSNYLRNLSLNDIVKGQIKKHKAFRFPKRSKEVIMISNGTGIAPFLGMINENHKQIKTHLFWGGRTNESFNLYKKIVDKGLEQNTLSSFYPAYSQEQSHKIYVQDILKQQADCIINTVKNSGTIMICGSVAMQKQVLIVLDEILQSKVNTSVEVLEQKGRLKMDCY